MQESYSYSSQPQAAPVKKSKYRDENEDESGSRPRSSNLMYDPRVFRGSNVVNKLMSSTVQDKKVVKEMRRVEKKRVPYGSARSGTPPPARGRQHADMQTEEYLEVLSDRPEETDFATQTPAAMDRPATPLFVRAKTGVDAETQIVQGDLFDFDLEVEPLLEVLVGRTIHVAMLEVMQEEELESVRRQQEEFEAVRNIELSEVQRLEAEASRRAMEKKRRAAQERQRLEEERLLEAKVAARAFARQYLSGLHDEVFSVLEAEGVFADPLRTEVEEEFMPSLYAALRTQCLTYADASRDLVAILSAAAEEAAIFGDEAIAQRDEEEEEARAVEEALRAAAIAAAAEEPPAAALEGEEADEAEELEGED